MIERAPYDASYFQQQDAEPQAVIRVRSGQTYDGTYYVDTVRHRFTARTYRQLFTLLRSSADSEVGDDITIRPELDEVTLFRDAL